MKGLDPWIRILGCGPEGRDRTEGEHHGIKLVRLDLLSNGLKDVDTNARRQDNAIRDKKLSKLHLAFLAVGKGGANLMSLVDRGKSNLNEWKTVRTTGGFHHGHEKNVGGETGFDLQKGKIDR
jgi:hypothetical protein